MPILGALFSRRSREGKKRTNCVAQLKESSLTISKILVPQIFEKMSMQELRALVTERSSMNIYISGESIEIKPHSVGFLLEGFIRSDDVQQGLIAPPAALLSSQSYLSVAGLESSVATNTSFCHSGSCYVVETRARVIFFDLDTRDSDSAFRKGSVSRLSQSLEPIRTYSKEHEGLMSWPENFHKARSPSDADAHQTNLSTRALELSIYGSMVNDMRRRFRSFHRPSQGRANHSLSYPRVPTGSSNARPLVSVQSEGGSMNRRLQSKDYARMAPTTHPVPVRKRKVGNVEHDDSSDESGGEEVIVRIDSPSTLSFHHAS